MAVTPIVMPIFSNRVLPAVYTDEISFYDLLNKVVLKLNELIEFVGDTATIKEIEEIISEIENEINSLYVYVDDGLENVKKYSDDKNSELESILRAVIADAAYGKILVWSQTGGLCEVVQKEIARQYDYLRYYAYNAGKIDSYEKTADELDAYNSTAYTIDLYNATLLDNSDALPEQDGN